MEDQQSEPGAVTDPAAESADDAESAAEATGVEADGEADTQADPDADAETEAAGEPETTAEARPGRRKAGIRIAVAAAAALFVGSAAFAAAAAQPYLIDRAEVATKLDIARTAARAIHTLWNYTPENMDTLPDRASIYLSGDLEAQYRKFIDAIAESTAAARAITGATKACVSVAPTTAPAIIVNTSATSELTKTIPQIKYLTYRLHMKRDHNRWVVTRMPTITSLDLTPRFQS
ncbi:hypothetical protein [Mycolicibacter sinensis]|uniref:hypothetical protein n=1 Tax=Mycolicibacter sinensis (strain JDM601) TaxID=875328 RepID=UPI0007EC01AF|nr:hypothetical protein [Mycolicibacter sinensis]OBH19562.1 mammalian cell entry protein [Mycolicibacter sinensis]